MKRLQILTIIAFVFSLGFGFAQAQAQNLTTAYIIPYARSDDTGNAETETVVSIHNRSGAECSARVAWRNGDNAARGTSGPVILANNQTLEFTTANDGDIIEPYILDVFRSGGRDFEGHALVQTDCRLKNIAVHATLVVNISGADNIADSYMSLKVVKPPRNKGD